MNNKNHKVCIALLVSLFSLLLLVFPLIATEAAEEKPLLVMLIGEGEYETGGSLSVFAEQFLKENFRITMIPASLQDGNRFPGIEALNNADLMLVSVRRRTLPAEQLAIVRRYVASGKPAIGIRTASHAFCLRRGETPEGCEQWPEFDAEVLGGNYNDHHSNKLTATISLCDATENHPIQQGVELPFTTPCSLYINTPLAEGAVPLFMGEVEGEEKEPIAWTFTTTAGGRVFYTSLGKPEDFENASFQRMLLNGIGWAAED